MRGLHASFFWTCLRERVLREQRIWCEVKYRPANLIPWGTYIRLHCLEKPFLLLRQRTLFSKRNATLICPFSLVALGHWPQHRVLVILLNGLGSDLKKTAFYNPRFTDIQSSPKETQLQKSCISFWKECICLFPNLITICTITSLVYFIFRPALGH